MAFETYVFHQEQIRRYNDWQKIVDASSLKSSKRKSKFHKKKKEKRVTFSEGPDGTVMVNKVYLDDTNGYAPGTLIPRIDRRADGSYWTNKQTINNNQRIYISDDSDYIQSWVPVRDYSNVSRNARPETR
ncbi:hypothetical protein FGIG_07410 [Fasciola gigantica]|uniref:Uncharacterized protein n=1 Tax=Fasciola gigantica TaxID=46835 RepID=A0A504YBA2_FASGI|nr:hypothetical protein FGIG_07410 [Fasciola gigantica]